MKGQYLLRLNASKCPTLPLITESPLTIPRCFSSVRRLSSSQLVFRYRANSFVNELLVLCNPFSIADKIFCVLLSDKKACTSTGGGCTTCPPIPVGARKCSEEIFFAVSEGFNPDDASKKFLPLVWILMPTYACCILSRPAPPARRDIFRAFSRIIPRLSSSLGKSVLPARILSFNF